MRPSFSISVSKLLVMDCLGEQEKIAREKEEGVFFCCETNNGRACISAIKREKISNDYQTRCGSRDLILAALPLHSNDFHFTILPSRVLLPLEMMWL